MDENSIKGVQMPKLGNWVIGTIGVILVLSGIGTMVTPVYDSSIYQATFDMSNVKWPLALLHFFGGIICLFFAITKKYSNCLWICLECEKSYYLRCDKTEKHCKYCGHSMEKLKGFYDRHPDRR